MSEYEYIWHKNRLEVIYRLSDLTLSQVERLISFEEEESSLSHKYHFSIWEEFDFQKTSFAKILRPDQFALFKAEIAKSVENAEIEMRKKDVEYEKDIIFTQQLIKYHREVFIPEIGVDFLIQLSHITRGLENKIRYLQNEYADFCNHEKKRILVEHFRNYKDFSPNLLELSLLRLELNKLWPEYAGFEAIFDDSNKSVVRIIFERAEPLSEYLFAGAEHAFTELEHYTHTIGHDIYGSRDAGGWEIKKDEHEEKRRMQHKLMSLILVNWNVNLGNNTVAEQE